MRTVWPVLHGDTGMNEATDGPELERGWCPVGLDPAGRREARRVGKELAAKRVKVLVSSDLRRAKETANIIGDVLGIEPVFHSQLRTWNLGDLTGKPQAEADKAKRQLVRRAPDRVPPGGESFNAFKRRPFAALADILANHEGAIALIIHGNVERLFEAWKAAGGKANHAIDVDTFLAEPEARGQIESMRVDPAALKLSHDESYFGHAMAVTKGDRCGTCKAYGGVNKCTKVKPPIDADDWCAVGVARNDGHWFSGGDRLPR